MELEPVKSTASESFADSIRSSLRHARTSASQVVSASRAVAAGSALTSLSPDDLRDAVYQSLAKLRPKQRAEVTQELIHQLRRAHINVASRLFILGIPARTTEELTPSDLAMLLRSVHFSAPAVMKALSATLGRLFSPDEA